MRHHDNPSGAGPLFLRSSRLCVVVTVGIGWLAFCGNLTSVLAGTLEMTILDNKGKPVPCRVHLKNAGGKPQRVEGLPYWRDHFVCPGSFKTELAAGSYTFEVERGPEYNRHTGSITVRESGTQTVSIHLSRIINLAAKGWYSGDLHVHRPLEDIELLMRAEDLHIAPVITWWNNRNLWTDRQPPGNLLVRFDGNRFYHVMAGEDEREGGALMYFKLHRPLEITGSSREYPSPMKFLSQARRQDGVWVDAEKPFWWDVPVWLASGQIDSIGLANNHMCRSKMYESEAWGRPRDTNRLPAPRGNGYWTQEIYYHILNCGLRVPPSAGSASGVLPNPLGYNRVYVHVGGQLSEKAWWSGLKAGRSFVTNGPLLLCQANGKRPGHVFSAEQGAEIEISLEVRFASNDHIPALEIIKNGRIDQTVPLDRSARSGEFGSLRFKKSGWFLVRAITDNQHTFRFASTAPFYVEIGNSKRRISQQSARFLADWADERAKRVPLKLKDPAQLREVLAHHERARSFWRKKVEAANAK